MAEIIVARIKSSYGSLKGLLSELPSATENAIVDSFIVEQLNQCLDELSDISNTDFKQYQIPRTQENESWPGKYPTVTVRAQLSRAIGRLEEEYNLGHSTISNQPNIVIINKNQSEITVSVDYTLNDLAEKIDNQDAKLKLNNLYEELAKDNKNWESIKSILIWIINFSKDLFLQILPIILKSKP